MHKFVIKNAIVVKPDETIQTSVLVRDGLIEAVGTFPEEGSDHWPVIGAEGCILMPGIIDIHTDALDMEIVPRPGADMPIPVAFRELERKMSGCGFTTVFHSLHLGYDVADDQLKSRYSRREVFETVHRAAAGPTLLDNKIHLRFEVTGVHAYETCLEFLESGMISLLSIMDHTPGQGQFGMEKYLQAMAKKGKTKEEALEEFRLLTSRPKIEGQRLETMIRLAKDNGIPVASHDDDTIEKIDLMHALGVDICEFPINLETAHHAIGLGMHVAGGASNILRGGSLSGNMNMKEAVLQGAVDTLCSDYYPPSLLHSIFRLHEDEDLMLHEAVNLATLHPARAARIHHYTGSIEPGKDADLLLVKMVEGLPVITHTIVKGNIVSQAALRNPAAVDNSTLCL